MFSKYYHGELNYFRENARAFARQYPTAEWMLGEQGGDSDLDRLAQGFSFLLARVQQRIDDEAPEIIHSLCEQVLPHALSSFPSATVVELTPIINMMRGRKHVEAGASLVSRPINKTVCQFRSTQPVDLFPLVIEEVRLDKPASSTPIIRLRFTLENGDLSEIFRPEGIRLYLGGDFHTAAMLRLWLLRHCQSITVQALGERAATTKPVSLGPECIAPVGFEREHALIPWPQSLPDGFRLLQEYSILPEKFLFVDLLQLHHAQSCADKRFEVAFNLHHPPPITESVGINNFKLNCVPAVNLFKSHASLIRPTSSAQADEGEFLVQADDLPAAHVEVYSVDTVHGSKMGKKIVTRYEPFFGAGPLFRPRERSNYYWVRRRLSPAGDGLDTYLALGTAPDKPVDDESELLSMELTCSNRALAGRLRIGDIVEDANPVLEASYQNIIDVTRPIPPPYGNQFWHLLGQLPLSHTIFSDRKSLQSVVQLFENSGFGKGITERSCDAINETILSLRSRRMRRYVDGDFLYGIGADIEIEESSFRGEGDIFIFGTILSELGASVMSWNSFCEIKVIANKSQTEMTWPPMVGRRTI